MLVCMVIAPPLQRFGNVFYVLDLASTRFRTSSPVKRRSWPDAPVITMLIEFAILEGLCSGVRKFTPSGRWSPSCVGIGRDGHGVSPLLRRHRFLTPRIGASVGRRGRGAWRQSLRRLIVPLWLPGKAARVLFRVGANLAPE